MELIPQFGESKMTIHEVQRGGNIHSLLSVLEVMSGNMQPYKSVHAIAVTQSEVLQLKAQSFLTMFQYSPDSMVRIVQLIATRLQRVTFLCLHNYLGLSSELIDKVCFLFFLPMLDDIVGAAVIGDINCARVMLFFCREIWHWRTQRSFG